MYKELGDMLQWMYPKADPAEDYMVQDDGNGQYLRFWNMNLPRPTEEDLKVAYAKYKKSKIKESSKVASTRSQAYPVVSDQLDAILKYLATMPDIAGTELERIIKQHQDVKVRNPKPEIK